MKLFVFAWFVLANAAALTAAPPLSIRNVTISNALRFEPNAGQADPRAQFIARSSRYTIFLTPNGPVLSLRDSHSGIRIRFVGGNTSHFEGARLLPGTVNYFRGSQAIANLPTYERVFERNLYPGIDAVFHGASFNDDDGQLEYDFIVAPGADPDRITLAFDGARAVHLNDRAEIELVTAAGTLTQRRPVLYQERGSRRIPVDGKYELRANSEFALSVGKYDRSLPLIIDPDLVFYTSLGGSASNQANGIALDSSGNIIVAGQTASIDFPVVGGVQNQLASAYAYRLDNGTTQTRLNGIVSSVRTFATDPKAPGTVYAATQNGLLKSTDSGATWAAIGAGLPAGALLYPLVIDPSNSQLLYTVDINGTGVYKSTDAGANWNAINNGITGLGIFDFQSGGNVMAIDPFQTSHLILKTDVAEFQTTDGGTTWTPYSFKYDCIAFDPDNQGVLYAAEPIGEIETIFKSTDDGATWKALGSVGSAVFTLLVDPHNSSILYAGAPSGFLKSADSGATWSTLPVPNMFAVGQVLADPLQPNRLYLQTYGAIYETTDGGSTFSPLAPGLSVINFAVSSNGASLYLATQAPNNLFVIKLDPTGKTILFSTYIGGSVSDQTADMALDSQGNIFLAGNTQSPDFPVTPGAMKSTGPMYSSPLFVLKLNAAGNKLVYSTTVDGGQATAIAVDSEDSAYIYGAASGPGLPITKGAYWTIPPMCTATGLIGCIPNYDGFVLKLNPSGSAPIYATYLHQFGGFVYAGTGTEIGKGIAVDSAGNAYLTGATNYLDKLNADGSALLYATPLKTPGRALAIDSSNNAYITGQNALVAKFDPNGNPVFSNNLSNFSGDTGTAIALDSAGDIVIAGATYSNAYPLFSPVQSAFAAVTGFLTKLDATGKNLLFSTYVGSAAPFLPSGLALDASGRAFICGSSTPSVNNIRVFAKAFVTVYDMSGIPNIRLDNVLNAASQLGGAISVGEIITLSGAGFGTASNTQLLFDQMPATLLSVTSNSLAAIAPYALDGKPSTQVQIQSGGAVSNPVWVAVAPSSPGIYSADGSGTGQALAFNQDGTRNSLSNPAAVGSTVTFYATGLGQTIPPGLDGVPHRSGPVPPANGVSVYIGDAYVSGPQYSIGPAPGFPADVMTIQAVVPSQPSYSNITLPGMLGVSIMIDGNFSQGIAPFPGYSTVQIAAKPN